MSKENLDQFMNQVADSEELQTRIGEEIDAESLIALGAECGCEFTAEELKESAELSDEELDGVAGGRSGGSHSPTGVVYSGSLGRTTVMRYNPDTGNGNTYRLKHGIENSYPSGVGH